MFFTRDLGDGFALGLRTTDSVDELLALINKNLARLRQWEQWALAEQTPEVLRAHVEERLQMFVTGAAVPCNIYAGGQLIGNIEMRINAYNRTAELGYWIDEDFEGRGVVTRACQALIEHGKTSLGVRRFELYTAAHNDRSGAVAKRLGFAHEGVMRSATPLGEQRFDTNVYGLVVASAAGIS